MKDRNWLVRMTNTTYTHWLGGLPMFATHGESSQLFGQMAQSELHEPACFTIESIQLHNAWRLRGADSGV